MSKSTKIIAALGVVAGLGVAALPAFTFAAETTGDVEVVVEVEPAIAMTITGNNDDGSKTTASVNYVIKAVEVGGDVTGLYELDSSDGWVATSDSTAQSGTTYYERVTITRQGVDNFDPAGMASTTTPLDKSLDGHPIPVTAIAGTSSSYAKLLPNALFEGSGAAGNGFRSTITVYTNNESGYTLAVKDKDTNTSLMHSTGKYSIQARAGALSAGTNGWNFDVIRHGATESSTFTPTEDGATEELTNQAITASDVEIDNWTAKTSSGRDTIVDYNVATDADQATGVYSDIIVYTATTNN